MIRHTICALVTGVQTWALPISSRPAGDPAFPVELRLLSETDLIKILANAYLSDFDPNNLKITPPNETTLRAVIAAAEQEAAAAATVAHLDEIVLFDIGEYFERYFSARIDTLRQTGYWDALIRLAGRRSEEHTSELQSLMRISYAVFCLKKKT